MAIIKNPLTIVKGGETETSYASYVKYSNTVFGGVFRPNNTSYPICNVDGTTPSLTYRGDTSFEYNFRIKAVGEIASHSNQTNLITAGTSGSGDLATNSPLFGASKAGAFFLVFNTDTTQNNSASVCSEEQGTNLTSHLNKWAIVNVKYVPNVEDGEYKFLTNVVFEDGTKKSNEYIFSEPMKNYSAVSQMICGYWKFNGNLFVDTSKSFIKINDVVVWGNEE